MSNSSLLNYTCISPNKNHPRSGKIQKITIHHMAGNLSIETCGAGFANPSRQASSNYGIGTDGRIGLYVDEEDRAWTSSSAENDNVAVTIEVSNDGGAPDWHVSDKALTSLISLCVDICRRNGIKRLNYTGDKSGNLTMHKWFAATSCPGPYLEGKFPYIAAEVNKQLGDASKGYISGNDIARVANSIVVYYNGERAPTNSYGCEVQVDKFGVVLNDPKYGQGKTEIPKGGKVISGHGDGYVWILQNLKTGYLVWITDGKINVSKKQHRGINGTNAPRGTNDLCVYNSGKTSDTNKYGYEVQVKDGVAIENPHYSGSTAIPAGGFVLSGHGDSGKWIYSIIKKGTKVSITDTGKVITIG